LPKPRAEFRNRLEAAAARSVLLSLERSPWALSERLGILYARILDAFVPRLRRTARINLSFAYPERDAAWRERMHEFRGRSVDQFFGALEADADYLTIPYGNVLCFTHTLMHGNRMNVEPSARWSLNVRFKGLFTPYSDKKLGDFFDPITLRPASRIGIDYRLPAGFDG